MNYKPDGFNTITAVATYQDTNAAIAFYQKTLGLTVDDLLESPEGVVLHACTTIGDSKLFMNDEFEGAPRKAPQGNTSVAFYLYVSDVDHAYQRAVSEGMTSISEPQDMFWGDRNAVVSDPFGYSWTLSTHIKDVPKEELEQAIKNIIG